MVNKSTKFCLISPSIPCKRCRMVENCFFRTFSEDKFCVVEVGDTGSGIDDKICGKIFDLFFTTKEKGVGLELSIAHKIVSQHNGKLSVESNNGNTVFTLHLLKN